MGHQGFRDTEWNDVLIAARHALAHLDAERLDEMALSCAALVREDRPRLDDRCRPEAHCGRVRQEKEAFARILEATKANLKVVRRLCEARTMELEYGRANGFAGVESENGHH